jgi:hypothetical protein
MVRKRRSGGTPDQFFRWQILVKLSLFDLPLTVRRTAD